ncbi:Crp/Fnr family transcriptional regulator [Litoribrevibacter euphylliae]|uniref:Crp/Fnr family transcriptional regulator n=1 Tax=Litoribrevibacter euphylliae TaxID=1834034 RepID=A0ABV7HE32_9GAMM
MDTNKNPLWHNFFKKTTQLDERIADLWLKTPLFHKISRKHCRALVPDMHLRTYQDGEVIFHQGETGIGAALILSGNVNITSHHKNLARLEAGDFFGEVALVVDEPRTANALAVGPTELIFFLRQNLDELTDRYPIDGARLMRNLAGILATRLRLSNQAISQTVEPSPAVTQNPSASAILPENSELKE